MNKEIVQQLEVDARYYESEIERTAWWRFGERKALKAVLSHVNCQIRDEICKPPISEPIPDCI